MRSGDDSLRIIAGAATFFVNAPATPGRRSTLAPYRQVVRNMPRRVIVCLCEGSSLHLAFFICRVHVCLGYYYTFLWKSRICFLEPFPQHCFHLYNDIAIRLADIIPFTGILFEIEEFRFPRLVMIDEFHI